MPLLPVTFAVTRYPSRDSNVFFVGDLLEAQQLPEAGTWSEDLGYLDGEPTRVILRVPAGRAGDVGMRAGLPTHRARLAQGGNAFHLLVVDELGRVLASGDGSVAWHWPDDALYTFLVLEPVPDVRPGKVDVEVWVPR